MTDLEKVRAAIIEAVPEIMELKFGCRFKFNGGPNGVLLNNRECKHSQFLVHWPLLQPKFDRLDWRDMDIEILGRPITLADVLRAIGIHGKEGVYPPELLAVGHPARWNLAKDNLDDQSPEVCDFLTSVLCNAKL